MRNFREMEVLTLEQCRFSDASDRMPVALTLTELADVPACRCRAVTASWHPSSPVASSTAAPTAVIGSVPPCGPSRNTRRSVIVCARAPCQTLARLYEETGENITLAVLDGDHALYIERLLGERSIPTVSRAGARLPLHTTGVGKVLLAYASAEVIERYLSAPLARPTPDSIVDPVRLLRDLEQVRTQGYSVTRQEMTIGSGSVAVPIIHDDECVAAVGVIVHLARLDVNRLVATLSRAATSIGAELELA